MMNRPELGQKCTIKATAYKTWIEHNPRTGKNDKNYPFTTKWIRNGCNPFTAHYIGYRVMPEGVTELEVDGDGEWQTWTYPVFNRTGSRIVWLFVENEKTTPVYAFPEDVTIPEW